MVLDGMLIGVGIIILLIGLLHLVQKEKLELGIICLIIGTGSFYGIFFDEYHWKFIFSLFFADYRAILVPSLAYIYFIRRANLPIESFHVYLKHLWIPLSILASYWILKFGLSSFFKQNLVYIVFSFRFSAFAITLVYFILGIRFLRKIQLLLKPVAYRNFSLIYKLLLGHLLLVLFILCADLILANSVYPQESTFAHRLVTLIYFLSYIPVLLFGTLELSVLKKFFFNELFIKQNKSSSSSEIENFIETELISNHSFSHPEFDLSIYLKQNLISENEFRAFVKNEYGETLNEFMNRLRVEYFKKLLVDPKNDQYDLPGLGKMAGFNSKATCYRVFKQIEGVTPNVYKESFSNH